MSHLIDTHCHLHDREFFTDGQAEEMLLRAHDHNVQQIICIGTSHKDSLAAAEFATNHNNVYWTYGIHPEFATKNTIQSDVGSISWTEGEEHDTHSDSLEQLHPSENIHQSLVGIGEVGLDYHYEGYNRTAQIQLFEQMLQLATDHDLPVSFHIREAFEDFFPVVANFPSIRGVVHSFTDNKKTLKRILSETDFYIGVNGLATYSTLPLPPLERILLETDAPFLTPIPFRGIINEPAYVSAVADWLSQTLGLEYQIIERETTNNATKLFGIQNPIFCQTKSL